MYVLITGSSGQIGTNLALRLLDEGHIVYGVDIRPNPWTDRIPTLLQDLSHTYTNFSNGIGFVEYPPDLDLVVHFAANAKVHDLVIEPQRALANITMTFNVLEFCRHRSLPIIFSSSREVYGDVHRYITEESHADFAYTESPYSASKMAGEALVYSYAQCYGLRYLIFRFSNVYGRYDNDLKRMERVIPLFVKKMLKQEMITIYGPDKVLDFTYIDDCIDGVYRGIELLASESEANHTINLAYGQGNSLITLAELIGKALDINPTTKVEPTRTGEVSRYVANIGKASTLLGYKPTTPLDKGIPKAIEWYLQWWEGHPE